MHVDAGRAVRRVAGGAARPGSESAQCESQKAWTIDKVGKDYLKLTGRPEVDCGDMKFYADQYIEIFSDVKRVVAVGNVLFVQGDKRSRPIAADFNYGTKLGTFYPRGRRRPARRQSNLRPESARREPLNVNQLGMYQATGEPTAADSSATEDRFGTQEPDVYFYGETIEKIGEDKYRVTKGGFTTCVQPKPRWELVSGSVMLNLDHYAFLKNSLFRSEGRPDSLLPGLLLSDQQGRPLHRHPDPGVRIIDHQGPHCSAMRSSGRSTAATMRRSCTTGSRRPGRATVASIGT